jgi:hypothetical protein
LRILFYSPDSYGLGHVRRTISLTGRLLDDFSGASALVLTGAPRSRYFQCPAHCDYLKLPSVTKDTSGSYVAREISMSLRGSVFGIAVAVGLVSWTELVRLVESRSRALLAGPFMTAVRASGAGRLRAGARHLLPNLAPVLVATVPLVAADGQRLLPGGWWMPLLPGLLLVAISLALTRCRKACSGGIRE